MIKEKRSWFQIGVLKERVAIQLDRRPKTEYRKPAPKPRGCPLSLNNKGATLVGSFRLRSSVFRLYYLNSQLKINTHASTTKPNTNSSLEITRKPLRANEENSFERLV